MEAVTATRTTYDKNKSNICAQTKRKDALRIVAPVIQGCNQGIAMEKEHLQ